MTAEIAFEWYVAQTRPHSERKAAWHLKRQGFDTYLPSFMKRRRHARRVEDVVVPLFPGYVFVAIDMKTQRWRCIQSTVGVARLVCNGEQPAVVPQSVIHDLKGQEDSRGLISIDSRPRFRRGDRVRILHGAFSSCLGMFDGMNDRERVSILLDLLGRQVRVAIGLDELTAA